MWVMLNDAFFSIVRKDAPPNHLLVRARREGDIEQVFNRHTKVEFDTRGDYAYRARVHEDDVAAALGREARAIHYDNFKDSVTDDTLHNAYLRVWQAMASVQETPPFSGRKRRRGK